MQDHATWLEARRKGIGGTDAAAILGLSRFRSARDVWNDKLGLAPERAPTAPMRWGLLLEETISRAYTERTGIALRRVGMRRAHHVPEFPMIGSIDRLAYDIPSAIEPVPAGGLAVELKTARSSDGFVPELEQDDVEPFLRIPADYYVQVQHYAEVVQVERVDCAVLVGGSDFRIYRIPRDREYGADLRLEESRFWRDYVEARVEPPVGPDDGPGLLRRFAVATDEEKVATAEVALELERLVEIDRTIDRLETERSLLANRAKEYLGTAKRLLSGSTVVRWSRFDRSSTAWKDYAGELEGWCRRLTNELRTAQGLDPESDPINLGQIRAPFVKAAPSEQFVVTTKET